MQQSENDVEGAVLRAAGRDLALQHARPTRTVYPGSASRWLRAKVTSDFSCAFATGPLLDTIETSRREWTINGDFLTLKENGVARFAREVTREFDQLVEAGHPLTRGLRLRLVAPRSTGEPMAFANIETCWLPEWRPRLPQVWVQAQLPRHARGGLLSFCNLAPIRADRHIVCLHDLQTRTTPGSYGWAFRLAHHLILPSLARNADIVTTVSAYSKATFVGFGLCSSSKIVVVPNGCDHTLRWRADRGRIRWRQDRPFVLGLGRNEAHKNTELIWRIAQSIDLLGLDVVVAGDFDAASLDQRCGGRPTNLRLVGRVSDDDLARGFSEALCFLFPSKTEGFGLPPLEAMSCGCPVVASLSPAVIESCGGAALYVDADDIEGWVEAVSRFLDGPELAAALRDAGHAQARRFTWREVAKTYLRLMAQVDRHAASHKGSHGSMAEPARDPRQTARS